MTRPKLPLCGDTIRPRLDARHSDPGWTITEQEPWMADALCVQVDPEIFYPDKGGDSRPAKRVCAACPVRAECLAFAVAHDERFGVWGGLSERERRRIKPRGVRLRPIAHGTAAGYRAHYRRNELPVCDACRRADARYKAEVMGR